MRVKDRKKQRREYLKQKVGAYGNISSGFMMCLLLLMLTILCGGLCLISLFFIAEYGKERGFMLISTAILGYGTIFCGSKFWEMTQEVKAARQRAKEISYVPPVTANTLPAEEVLVRGAQHPIQEQSTTLLRAAEESPDVPAEQLLRAATQEDHAK